MMSDIIEFFIKVILGFIIFVVLFPIIWILATPFILGGSFFVNGDYKTNVLSGYKAVSKTWIDWAVYIIP